MRSMKYMALGAMLLVGAFFAVMYSSSCTKDACKGVTCLHKGVCSGGSCVCNDSIGVGGVNCEITYSSLYDKNTYQGNTVVGYGSLDSPVIDTNNMYLAHTDINNTMSFVAITDTDFSEMNLTWIDNGLTVFVTPIKLTHNSATGSTFAITNVQGQAPWDNYTFSGTGSVNSTNATMNLVAVSADTTKPSMTFTLSNFSKK